MHRLNLLEHQFSPFIADGTDDVTGGAVNDMGVVAQFANPLEDFIFLFFLCACLHNDNHLFSPLENRK